MIFKKLRNAKSGSLQSGFLSVSFEKIEYLDFYTTLVSYLLNSLAFK